MFDKEKFISWVRGKIFYLTAEPLTVLLGVLVTWLADLQTGGARLLHSCPRPRHHSVQQNLPNNVFHTFTTSDGGLYDNSYDYWQKNGQGKSYRLYIYDLIFDVWSNYSKLLMKRITKNLAKMFKKVLFRYKNVLLSSFLFLYSFNPYKITSWSSFRTRTEFHFLTLGSSISATLFLYFSIHQSVHSECCDSSEGVGQRRKMNV